MFTMFRRGLVTVALLAVIIGAITATGSTAGATGDCRYANFNGTTTYGVVEVCGVHPGTIGTMTVILKTDHSGAAFVCAARDCSAVAAGNFDAGCVDITYPIGLDPAAPDPKSVHLLDAAYVPWATKKLSDTRSRADYNKVIRHCST